MESYGFVYDPNILPELPPAESISFPIWQKSLPLQAFDRLPEFINTSAPEITTDWTALLDQASCSLIQNQPIKCSLESPLAGYGCVWICPPQNAYPGLDLDVHVLATCSLQPDDPEEPPSAYLYRGGCAFRADIAFIMEQDGKYRLLRTKEELKSLLVPIDTPEKALTYAEKMTGLDAVYQFEPDPDLLYFQDQIEGTQVKEENGVYTINLFHFQHCFCEPWINSIVIVTVDRAGNLTWQSASPWSMTLGFSCAD